ncbi:mitogen-activated protein kinase kinase kinase 5-like isoform X2 [Cornus florida]|uniref:mitogen-activated protein kinase kinase kinase 5-like isoform X2 n=1 Tax=Cornus florida TaxID=4283 RepID=UPI002897AE9C|nr:mitogen-activated protein kinase kinase kinase 5-like isoform X2 [Cornus florida]
MHWLNSAFSRSSSSKHHSADNPGHRVSRILRSSQRRLTRARKLRHLTDDDIGVTAEADRRWHSPSTRHHFYSSRRSSSASPQPLPLPELALLLRCDASTPSTSNSCSNSTLNSNTGNVPLPSPKEAPSIGGEERERADGLTGNGNGKGNGDGVTSSAASERLASQDTRKNTEHAETQSSRKVPRELNVLGRNQDSSLSTVFIGNPTSPFSSPALSPQINNGDIFSYYHMSPQVIQVWSAPEMPPLDMTLGLGCPNQMYPEKTAFSVDNSPLHSPRASPRRTTRSPTPTGPASPLHNKLSLETSIAPRESNAQAHVHPLPLPPGAATPSQPVTVNQVTAKPELKPMKSQWKKGKPIGRGTFGSVYVATNRETGALCAMKEVEILQDDPKSAECITQLQQEIKLLSQLKHPNIVQYYGSEIVGNKFHIYLEYVHPGSINKYIRDHCGAITESVIRNFTRHILSGLAYLHSTKTIHRDIKGANLLVDAYGVVKLADFGMAKHLSGQTTYLSLKGSPYWMAPELLQPLTQKDANSDLALAVDIWSLGCTIIEMLNGKPPWSEYEGAAAMFKVTRETPTIPQTLSSEGKDFLRCCFCRNPAERPSASMLLEHRFLKNSQQLDPSFTQVDIPSFTQALSGMKLRDQTHTPQEHSNHKLDQVPVSPTLSINGNPGNKHHP